MRVSYPVRPAPASPIARLATAGLCTLALLLPGAAGAGEAAELVPYTVEDAARIPASLTGEPGDRDAGARLFVEAGCVACHGGDGAGPRLPAPGGGEAARIRLWLVAPEVIRPDLASHSVYRAGQRRDPTDPRHNGPRLAPAEIEALVAHLATAGAD